MKKYIIISLLALTSCVNATKDYYGKESAVVNDETLLSYIESRPEYSIFAGLVREVGAEKYLSGTTLMTLFVPTDDKAPENIAEMSDTDKEMLVLNHIALTTFYSRNLGNVSSVMTLCGKTVSVTSEESVPVLNGIALTECDQVCNNGVLHKADGWITPRKNIMEWIKSLDDDYSMVRDSIIYGETRVFDKENSPVKGVDENGRVVYDSVWVVSNKYIGSVDVGKEGVNYTFMAPSNEAINNFFKERNDWFKEIGHEELNDDDKSVLYTWLFRSSLIRGINDFSAESIRTVSGNEIRTAYFNAESIEPLSNGAAIRLDKCYVPKNMYYSKVSFNPYFIRLKYGMANATSTEDGNVCDVYDPVINVGNSPLQNNVECVKLQWANTPAAPKGYSYKFMSMASSDSTDRADLVPIKVMPGKYNLRMRFCTNSDNETDSFEIYRLSSLSNDAEEEFVATVEGIKSKAFGVDVTNNNDLTTDGLVAEDLEFKGELGPVYLKVLIPKQNADGKRRRMFVGTCTLIPQDNY